jgi:hypothetical protein
MPKTMIKPGRDLLRRVNQAFLDHGYSGLSMVTMAKACGFTQRAPSESIPKLEAGKAMRAKGGSALDIIAEILDIRYGDTRRRVIGSPHTVELNAEAFKRCRDIMIRSAVTLQAELAELIVDLEKSRMLK